MLSKEQLEKISNPGPVDIGGAQNPIVTEMATELLSLREQLAAINGAQEPVGFVKCDPCAEDCRWDCVDPIYLAGSVTPEGYGSDYFEVYRHPAPLKE
ncbi:hypothetical protein ACROQ8_004539 [Yersinia enterocolitica]|nr:hypothetical protein [Yersinia enterocolitica]EME3603466.1 hypothetical protein [Yersinia enterocolitica]HEI6883739.1 hypothetical protein [Yersinia enterocolitica]HEN3551555.1 hypothetical protein [Yersinia enterocolitica]